MKNRMILALFLYKKDNKGNVKITETLLRSLAAYNNLLYFFHQNYLTGRESKIKKVLRETKAARELTKKASQLLKSSPKAFVVAAQTNLISAKCLLQMDTIS